MDFSELGGREAIILAMVLVAVYLLVSLLRLGLIKLRQRRMERSLKRAAEEVGGPSKSGRQQAVAETPRQVFEPMPADIPPSQPHLSFDEQLFRSGVETELQQLRNEVAALKDALSQLKALRPVSPQYNEAILLAQRGMNAQSIADHCAISIGEAELVVALSRNKQEYENYDNPYDRRE